MGISQEFAWKYAGGRSEISPALLACMDASQNHARMCDWIVNLAHGVPLHITVVKPNAAVRVTDMDTWIGTVMRVVETVDRQCHVRDASATAMPRRPASIMFTIYLWDEKKRLPAKRGEMLSKDACNTGMCTRYPADGRCEIIVYRREDAVKTLIHEVLHAYHVADWCNEDAAILLYAAQLGARLLAPPNAVYQPAETVVDAVAMRLYHKMFRGAWGAVVMRSDALRRRVLRHFAGAGWRQDTPALEYLVLRHALIAQPSLMRAAFANGFQNPKRNIIRNAFLNYDQSHLLCTLPPVTGRSLCSTA